MMGCGQRDSLNPSRPGNDVMSSLNMQECEMQRFRTMYSYSYRIGRSIWNATNVCDEAERISRAQV